MITLYSSDRPVRHKQRKKLQGNAYLRRGYVILCTFSVLHGLKASSLADKLTYLVHIFHMYNSLSIAHFFEIFLAYCVHTRYCNVHSEIVNSRVIVGACNLLYNNP